VKGRFRLEASGIQGVNIAAYEGASFNNGSRPRDYAIMAAMYSPNASEAVSPGDSMPKRFTMPAMP
jgi:hypothetical protein